MRRPLLLLVVALAGCSSQCGRSTGTRFDGRERMVETIRGADQITLYEGLPHPFYDPAYQTELESKPTVTLNDHPFYRDPVTVRDGATDRLRAVLGAVATFGQKEEPLQMKKCGGFHPDWCVEWGAGDERTRCLLCFGCNEAKVYGPAGGLYCDLSYDAAQELKAVLDPHRTNRPPAKLGR